MRRRHFLQLGGGLALALLTVGCGSSAEDLAFATPSHSTGGGVTARLSEDLVYEVDASGRILELDPTEGIVRGYDTSGALAYTSSAATNPASGALGPDGTAYILDLSSADVVVLSPSGQLLRRMSGDGALTFARDLAFGNDELYILDHASQAVHVFSLSGEVLRTLSVGELGTHLRALVVDAGGNLRVLSSNPVEIRVLDPETGQLLRSYGANQALSAVDFAVTPDGSTVIVDHVGHQLLVFGPDGQFSGARSAFDAEGDKAQPLRLSVGSDGQLYLSISEVA